MSEPAADRAAGPALSREEYFRRWSELHEGIDPAGVRFVRGWLSIAYAVARPLAAARVPPIVVTVAGLLAAIATVPVAGLGARWPLLGLVIVVASGLLDNLDGAVAVLTDRVTARGCVGRHGLRPAGRRGVRRGVLGLGCAGLGRDAWVA